MPSSTAGLTGLLPLAGIAALMVNGVARSRARSGRTASPPPQPKEMPPPDPSPRRVGKTLPDAVCEGCGTTVPGTDSLCPLCAHQRTGSDTRAGSIALRWVGFFALMAVIFGVCALFAP